MLLSPGDPPLDSGDEKRCSKLQDCFQDFKEYHRVGRGVNYDSTPKAKKRKKEIAGFKPYHRKLLPIFSVSNLFLTPIYCPGKRCNWNRITVFPQLPAVIIKYQSHHKGPVYILTFWPKHKFRRAVYHNKNVPGCSIISGVEMTMLYWIYGIFFSRSCCRRRLKSPFWFPSFLMNTGFLDIILNRFNTLNTARHRSEWSVAHKKYLSLAQVSHELFAHCRYDFQSNH